MKYIDINLAKSILDYNPETGLFTWRLKTSYRINVGDIAGYKERGYTIICFRGNITGAHRLAWAMYYNEQPMEIDHINGIKDDNRIANLRICTKSENQSNKSACKNNKSGFKGVFLHKKAGKWVAQISKNNKQIYLGLYANIDDAVKAYQDAAKIYHGEFAKY